MVEGHHAICDLQTYACTTPHQLCLVIGTPLWVQVTVTGAGGRTGKLILQKLLAQPDKYTARGLVRDEKV